MSQFMEGIDDSEHEAYNYGSQHEVRWRKEENSNLQAQPSELELVSNH